MPIVIFNITDLEQQRPKEKGNVIGKCCRPRLCLKFKPP